MYHRVNGQTSISVLCGHSHDRPHSTQKMSCLLLDPSQPPLHSAEHFAGNDRGTGSISSSPASTSWCTSCTPVPEHSLPRCWMRGTVQMLGGAWQVNRFRNNTPHFPGDTFVCSNSSPIPSLPMGINELRQRMVGTLIAQGQVDLL